MEYDPDVFRDKTIFKIFILTNDKTGDRKIDVNDLEQSCLTDDGDFRSVVVDEESRVERQVKLSALRRGRDVNKSKIWKLNEMDADHVATWSKGGATDIKNCQMLCKTHNRTKGNR